MNYRVRVVETINVYISLESNGGRKLAVINGMVENGARHKPACMLVTNNWLTCPCDRIPHFYTHFAWVLFQIHNHIKNGIILLNHTWNVSSGTLSWTYTVNYNVNEDDGVVLGLSCILKCRCSDVAGGVVSYNTKYYNAFSLFSIQYKLELGCFYT